MLSGSEDVTPEAVEALLADHDGVAWPVFVDGSTTQARTVSFLEGQTCRCRSTWGSEPPNQWVSDGE